MTANRSQPRPPREPRNHHIDTLVTAEVLAWIRDQAAAEGLRPGTWMWVQLLRMMRDHNKQF